MNKTCIVIVGPTAVGKTRFAIQLAQYLSTKIISADSRQCYKELDIGVAKPSREELDMVKHYFINTHSVTEEVNAAVFEEYSLKVAAEIFQHNDYAVMEGGTGLYIKAFCEGMDEIPDIQPGIRAGILLGYKNNGMEWLQDQVKEKDPAWFAEGETKNPQRLMRALEVIEGTGISITYFLSGEKKVRPFNIVKIGLEIARPQLYQQINDRVDRMMKAGLLSEVEELVQYRYLNALQTVGYRELFEYADGMITLEKAVDLIKQNTRHYAKRQVTWFKKDPSIQWISPHLPISSFMQGI